MNSRKLFALFLVFALTGSALAAQQNQYLNTGLEARDVKAVQQHTVFVEIVVEQEENRSQIHEFAAVVGLVKKCKEVRNVFDNAVLWFNDQFLFGDKQNDKFNVTPNRSPQKLNPNRTHNGSNATGFDSTVGFVEKGDANEEPKDFNNSSADANRSPFSERWGGCFIPDGFMHAIGADDPYGIGAGVHVNESSTGTDEEVSDTDVPSPFGLPNDNMDFVKEIIDLDNSCGGCLIEYQSTFFITDPNDHQWMVDKLIYPVSITETDFTKGGNLFGENRGEDTDGTDDCANDENATTSFSDPRDDYPHQDRCTDTETGDEPNDQENHCEDGSGERCGAGSSSRSDSDQSLNPLFEPIYTVRVQVDPTSATNQGFADEAPWSYRDGTVRQGAPYPDDGPTNQDNPGDALAKTDPNYDECKADLDNPHPCAIEYNFLLAVDFAAFDDFLTEQDVGTARADVHGENEVKSDAVVHGEGGANDRDTSLDGNSHRHNAGDQVDAVGCDEPNGVADAADPCHPKHEHDVVNLDLFFDTDAPYFVEANPYWDDYGAPPTVDNQCRNVLAPSDNADAAQAADQKNAVKVRAPIVCDVDADDGYHLHDGTQTIPDGQNP